MDIDKNILEALRLAAAGVSSTVSEQILGHTDSRTHEVYNHDTSRAAAAIDGLK